MPAPGETPVTPADQFIAVLQMKGGRTPGRQGLPRDRLERTLVLNEVQILERQERVREGVLKQINRSPELRQAYEVLVKNVPEDQRENAMLQIAGQTRRALNHSRLATVNQNG